MPDLGIGEALAAIGPELFAGGGEAVAGAGEAAAAGAGALDTGLSAAESAIATGASEGFAGAAPLGITVNAIPGAAEGAAAATGGFDLGGLIGGAGAALGGLSDALIPSAAASTLAPGAQPGTAAAPGVSSNADPFSALSSPGAQQGGGVGASSFAPTPGVNLGGVAPDATSAAAFNNVDTSFAARAAPAVDAGSNGTFSPFESPQSPVGSGQGAASFSQAPAGAVDTTFPSGNTPTASPDLGNFATSPGAPAASAAPTPSGLDVSGNPIDPATGSSNPQYASGATSAQYDPSGATIGPNAGAAPGSTNPISQLGQGAADAFNKNPLGLALGAGGLGLAAVNANAQSKAVKTLQQQAAQEAGTANQLSNYALNGTLPPGSQAAVDQSIAEAKANAISNAAGQGLPTDPTKNTALAATLAKIDQQGPILAAQIAQQLLSSGASFAGLSDQLYGQLANIDQSQKAAMGKAIANFAAALNTNNKPVNIQFGGTSAAA